jgi:hypothetical protein
MLRDKEAAEKFIRQNEDADGEIIKARTGFRNYFLRPSLSAVYMSAYIQPPNFAVSRDLSGSIFQQLACFQQAGMFRLPSPPPPFFSTCDSANTLLGI